MHIITEISPKEKLLIEAVKTLSPDQQREAMNFIKFLQQQGQKSHENEPELVTDNSAVKINIYQILGESNLTFERQGQQIYPLIAEGLKRGKSVLVSFQNIERITWSFITKAIAQLYEHFTESEIDSSVKFIEITSKHLTIVEQVIKIKKDYLREPKTLNRQLTAEELEQLRGENPDNPIFQMVGMFKDDETFDDMLAYIKQYRSELDEEYFREIDGGDGN